MPGRSWNMATTPQNWLAVSGQPAIILTDSWKGNRGYLDLETYFFFTLLTECFCILTSNSCNFWTVRQYLAHIHPGLLEKHWKRPSLWAAHRSTSEKANTEWTASWGGKFWTVRTKHYRIPCGPCRTFFLSLHWESTNSSRVGSWAPWMCQHWRYAN